MNSHPKVQGFTLIEVLIAMLVTTTIGLAVSSIMHQLTAQHRIAKEGAHWYAKQQQLTTEMQNRLPPP